MAYYVHIHVHTRNACRRYNSKSFQHFTSPSALSYLPSKMDRILNLSYVAIPLVTWLAWFLLVSRKNNAIPTVGLRQELFAHIRTTVRNMREAEGLKNLQNFGYQKVN